MNKLVKYGVVAGITMASFSLQGVPMVLAVEDAVAGAVQSYVCDSEEMITEDTQVVISKTATTCEIKVKFAEAIEVVNTPGLGVTSTSFKYEGSNGFATGIHNDFAYNLDNAEDGVVALTIATEGIEKIRNAEGRMAKLVVKNNTGEGQEIELTLVAEKWERSLKYSVNGGEPTNANSETIVLDDAVENLIITATFENEILDQGPFGNGLFVGDSTFDGLSPIVSAYFNDEVAEDGHTVTYTLKGDSKEDFLSFLSTLGNEGADFVVKNRSNGDEQVAMKLVYVNNHLDSIETNADEDGKLADENIEITAKNAAGDELTIEDGLKVTYVVEGEGNDQIIYMVPSADALSTIIKVADDYLTAVDQDFTINVTVTDKYGNTEPAKVSYTLKANYTVVDAWFVDSEDKLATTIAADETAAIAAAKANGVTYSYSYNNTYITIDEDGEVSVNDGFVATEDVEVEINVLGHVADEEETVLEMEEPLVLTIEANYDGVEAGFGDEMRKADKIGAGETVTIKTDGKAGVDYDYTTEADFVEINEDSETGVVTVSVKGGYKSAVDQTAVITVSGTANVGGKNLGPAVELTLVVEANYTAIEAGFGDAMVETVELEAGDTTTVKATEAAGVTYEYVADWIETDERVEWDAETQTITVAEDAVFYAWTEDTVYTFSVTVNGTVGEGEDAENLPAKTLTFTVAPNRTVTTITSANVTKGDGQEYVAGSEEMPSFTIDAERDYLQDVTLQSKTLLDEFRAYISDGKTYDEAMEMFGEFERSLIEGLGLEEDTDYTVESGSTIITLADSLVAKLAAGEYEMFAYYNGADEEGNLTYGTATMSFSVLAEDAPDSGAFTATKAGATTSIFATVAAVIAAAGAAIAAKVAKIAKRK